MRYILLFISFNFAIAAQAQMHDFNWLKVAFGEDSTPLRSPHPGLLINFSTSPPTSTYFDVPFSMGPTPALLSDENGMPILASNGYHIYHPNGQIVSGGDSLMPIVNFASYNYGVPQVFGALFLPIDAAAGDYHYIQLFLDPWGVHKPQFLLTKLTGVTDSFSGTVVYKEKLLFEGDSRIDKFNVTRHANGKDWWLVFSNIDSLAPSRTFYSFLIDQDSFSFQNQQVFPEYTEQLPPTLWGATTSNAVFSPDGRFFISLDYANGINIHEFDRCTGILGPLIRLPYQLGFWGGGGVAVSSNSRFLYSTNTEFIFQYDLYADDINSTKQVVAAYDGYVDGFTASLIEYPILAPDGKIYITSNPKWFHVINKPNEKGIACDARLRSELFSVFYSDPHFYPNYRLGPIDGSTCDTLGINNIPLADFWWFNQNGLSIEFSDNSFYEPSAWHWNFGDGTESQDTSPVHLFPAIGNYEVCLTVSNSNGSDTVCKTVPVGVTSTAESHQEMALKVFPNPADALIFWESPEQPVELAQVYDLWGKLVLEQSNPKRSMDIQALKSGVYILLLKGVGHVCTAKVIKY